jgi:hypothetical protein
MKDLRHDRLTRRGQRCTVAIEQAVEYGTQNYGDRFYLPVKPGPADAPGNTGDGAKPSSGGAQNDRAVTSRVDRAETAP